MPLELLSPLSLLRIILGIDFLAWPVLALATQNRARNGAVLVAATAIVFVSWVVLLIAKEVSERQSHVLAVVATVVSSAVVASQGSSRLAFVCLAFFGPICAFQALSFPFRVVFPYQFFTALCIFGALEHAEGAAVSAGIAAAAWFALCSAAMPTALTVRSARRHAAFDPETGLPNALGLSERFRSRGEGEVLILACVFLEGVGDAREAFGHRVGIELLRRSIEHLGQVAPANAVISRVAGDELLVAYSSREPAGAEVPSDHDLAGTLADTLARAISKGVFVVDGIELSLRPHVGLATSRTGDVEIAQLIRQASLAAHRASELRQVQALWNGQTNSMTADDMALLSDLRVADERGELSLVYQPQVSSATGRTIAVEALLRWESRRHGSVPPGHFIPLAERGGVIDRLTEWVLCEALDAQLRWQQRGLSLPVSVNLSAQTLTRPNLSSWVLDELRIRQVPPTSLQLEVTETAETVDLLQAVDLLRPLHEKGVRVSLDDFGTGYTSLSVLPFLPLDELKVDQRFVRLAPISAPDEAIVRSVGELAHRLGLSAVAEGVENEEIRDLMTSFGIDVLQGYQISKPLSEPALLEFVRREEQTFSTEPSLREAG
jgi:EAL domain-containing protein (putative c-di-GMP-specific phosphodiesterase class I)/GGDEF domain-containing protein